MAQKKLLLLADVHGNLEALKAVLNDAERIEKSFGEIIVLGDTVDYYAQPNECLELLKRKKAIILQGNHDAAAIGELDTSEFRGWPVESLEWTKKKLNEKSIQTLKHMPKFFGTGLLLCIHGSPRAPLREYMNKEAAEETFRVCGEQLIICGHVHKCFSINEKLEKTDYKGGTTINFKGKRMVFSLPSVGQPRDGNPHTGYAILDLKKFEITVKRIPYDVQKTVSLAKKEGLPEKVAEGLFEGDNYFHIPRKSE